MVGEAHPRGTGALAKEIRSRLGPPPQAPEWPLVSIVVLNRDGAPLLRRLLAGLTERTDYPNIELIVVDNASSDDSLDFIRTVEAPFPISILANPHNESFSDACDQGAEIAAGELLLFCNNDIEPFESAWLAELVSCLLSSETGAVSATLICLEEEHKANFPHGYGIQHRGLAFREEDGMLHPTLHGWEADPLDEMLGQDLDRGAVAAACLLVKREAYDAVNGFSHGYLYGAEDIDLCLKLRESGHSVLCSGRSLAIHHPVSTRRSLPFEEQRTQKLGNRRLLWERWGPRLRCEYELDLLDGGGIWAEMPRPGDTDPGDAKSEPRPTRAQVEALGFCLKAAEPSAPFDLDELAAAIRGAGHRCLLLEGDSAEDVLGLNYDVAVHLHGKSRYIPKHGQLSVFWLTNSAPPPFAIECGRYDLLVGESADLHRQRGEEAHSRPPQAVLSGSDAAALAAELIAAAEARAREVGLRTRVRAPGALSPTAATR